MIIEKLEKTPRISGTAFENKAKTLFTMNCPNCTDSTKKRSL